MFYTSLGQNKLWCALGGTGEDEPSTIVFEMGKEKQHFGIPISDRPGASGDAISFQLVFNDPNSNATDPASVIALSRDGKLHAFAIAPTQLASTPASPRSPGRSSGPVSPFRRLALPPPLPLQLSSVQQSLIVNCPEQLLSDLRKVCNVAWDNNNDLWPLRGGSFPPVQSLISKLLITAHEDCVVRFFDVSIRAVIMLYELQLPVELTQDQRDGLAPKPSATCMHFCSQSRFLSIGLTDGSVFVFNFSLKDNATPTVAEWPEPAPAPKSASSLQLDSVAVAEPQSASPAPTEAMQSSPTPSESPAAPATPPPAEPATTISASPATPPPVEPAPFPAAQFRGFQLVFNFQIGEPISTLSLESASGLFAIGTFRGSAFLFALTLPPSTTRTAPLEKLFSTVPAANPASTNTVSDQLSPVMQIRFAEATLEKYGAVTLALIARENGSVYVVNLKNLAAGAGRALTGRDAAVNEANKNFAPQLLNFYVVTERGRSIHLAKRVWLSDDASPAVEGNQAAPLAPTQAAPSTATPPAQPAQPAQAPQQEVFLVMVFVNCIITYRVPSFEKAELVQTKAPLAWCSPVRVTKANQDECCLICVDMGANLFFHNLMSLKLLEKSYNLRSAGVDTKYAWVRRKLASD